MVSSSELPQRTPAPKREPQYFRSRSPWPLTDDGFRRPDPRGRRSSLFHHHLAERGHGRAGHLLQTRNRLPEGSTLGFPERLLELRFLLPAHQRGNRHTD
jgi:hypothetical protein